MNYCKVFLFVLYCKINLLWGACLVASQPEQELSLFQRVLLESQSTRGRSEMSLTTPPQVPAVSSSSQSILFGEIIMEQVQELNPSANLQKNYGRGMQEPSVCSQKEQVISKKRKVPSAQVTKKSAPKKGIKGEKLTIAMIAAQLKDLQKENRVLRQRVDELEYQVSGNHRT